MVCMPYVCFRILFFCSSTVCFSDCKHRPMSVAFRSLASIAVGLSGVLIAFYNDHAAEVEETSPGEFFCPAPPPCPEVEVSGFRAWVFGLLLREDSLLEAGACAGVLCVAYVLYRLFSHGCRACRKCCCQSRSRRQGRRVSGGAAVPAGYEALGDLRRGSRVLA